VNINKNKSKYYSEVPLQKTKDGWVNLGSLLLAYDVRVPVRAYGGEKEEGQEEME